MKIQIKGLYKNDLKYQFDAQNMKTYSEKLQKSKHHYFRHKHIKLLLKWLANRIEEKIPRLCNIIEITSQIF